MGNAHISGRRAGHALDYHHGHAILTNASNPNNHAPSHDVMPNNLGHDVMPNHFGHDVSGDNPGLVAPDPPSYPAGHYNLHTNGHLVINITQPNHSFMISDGATPGHVSSSSSSSSLGHVSMPSVLPLPHFVESPKANTIINDVNVRKDTLRVEKDHENPGFYLVSFSFDATTDGWMCILFHAKEGRGCSLTAMKPEVFAPLRIPFTKGLDQHFRQAPGTGVDLSSLAESQGPMETFPLIIRTETMPNGPPLDISPSSRDEEPVDSPLPNWVNAQMTHAVLEKKDGNYIVKVVKQTIYVEGVRYELQEIYGIENVNGCAAMDGTDVGKECVICLSELRDTTVLPCRHMCMCSGCAKVLRFQSNRCPICRTPVERLLEIRVSKKDEKRDIVNEAKGS